MGVILVFDLDQTLIDSNEMFISKENIWNRIGANLNMRLINEVLKPALELRADKKVDAIFLLSNNSSTDYVLNVIRYLSLILGVDELFDYSMIRTHPSRPKNNNPPKRMIDIKYMMNNAIIPIPYTDDLASRVYFFDDKTNHVIRKEFEPDHYIEIRGPDLDAAGNNMGFIAGKPDVSDYITIKHVLDSLMTNKNRNYTNPVNPPYLSLDGTPMKRALNTHGGSKTRRIKRKTRKSKLSKSK